MPGEKQHINHLTSHVVTQHAEIIHEDSSKTPEEGCISAPEWLVSEAAYLPLAYRT